MSDEGTTEEAKEVLQETEPVEDAEPTDEQKPEQATKVPERFLVIGTDGTKLRIVNQQVTNLELLAIGELLVNTAKQAMSG